jgi:hypothetical protein
MPLLPPGNVHLLLRIDLSFPSPSLIEAALLPKLFPLENTNYLLIAVVTWLPSLPTTTTAHVPGARN